VTHEEGVAWKERNEWTADNVELCGGGTRRRVERAMARRLAENMSWIKHLKWNP
jgi:hypothetical protein